MKGHRASGLSRRFNRTRRYTSVSKGSSPFALQFYFSTGGGGSVARQRTSGHEVSTVAERSCGAELRKSFFLVEISVPRIL
jgi:hypothetical protein